MAGLSGAINQRGAPETRETKGETERAGWIVPLPSSYKTKREAMKVIRWEVEAEGGVITGYKPVVEWEGEAANEFEAVKAYYRGWYNSERSGIDKVRKLAEMMGIDNEDLFVGYHIRRYMQDLALKVVPDGEDVDGYMHDKLRQRIGKRL